MNIDEIAVKVAREVPSYSYDEPYAYQKRFANALLAELANQEPLAHRYKIINAFGDEVWTEKPDRSWRTVIETQPLYAAPLPPAVPEGWKQEVEDLFGEYWDCAYNEGHLQRSDADKANEILYHLRKLLTVAPTPKE